MDPDQLAPLDLDQHSFQKCFRTLKLCVLIMLNTVIIQRTIKEGLNSVTEVVHYFCLCVSISISFTSIDE